ncbi:MAG TPA: 3-deoxy-D-manno-octulosonic acid kinase, partial [Steroidobacteraceae bacterium]|nr:3-deoxy-D-manno-octulosonic acid kinase [Steroidobacteraceae bacterium]
MPLLEGVAIIIRGSGRRIATGSGAMLVVDARTPDWPEASGEALFDPSHWRRAGSAAPAGRGRGAAWFVGDGTRDWVLRHYRRGGLVARLVADRYCWVGEDRVRAFAEWRLLDRLWRRGLPVPRPVAARYRRDRLCYRCDLITCRIPDARPLSERLVAGGLPEAHWAALGAAVARLHREGVDHADLNAHNVLIDDHGRVSFVDFDRGRLRASGGWAARNLRRLRRSLRKLGAAAGGDFEVEWRALMSAYAAAGRVAAPPTARRSSVRPMRSLYRVLIRIAA